MAHLRASWKADWCFGFITTDDSMSVQNSGWKLLERQALPLLGRHGGDRVTHRIGQEGCV